MHFRNRMNLEASSHVELVAYWGSYSASIQSTYRYEKTLLSPEVIIALRGERFTGVSSVHATARLKLELYTFSSR